jgi:hypothetical protein
MGCLNSKREYTLDEKLETIKIHNHQEFVIRSHTNEMDHIFSEIKQKFGSDEIFIMKTIFVSEYNYIFVIKKIHYAKYQYIIEYDNFSNKQKQEFLDELAQSSLLKIYDV